MLEYKYIIRYPVSTNTKSQDYNSFLREHFRWNKLEAILISSQKKTGNGYFILDMFQAIYLQKRKCIDV